MELHTIDIDLGKTVFHLVGLSLRGEVAANAGTAICEGCSYRAHAQFCNIERSSLPA